MKIQQKEMRMYAKATKADKNFGGAWVSYQLPMINTMSIYEIIPDSNEKSCPILASVGS